MAAPAVPAPLVRVRLPDEVLGEQVWMARLLAWARTGDGSWSARVAWHEATGDAQGVVEVTAALPADCVEALPGQDYRDVPRTVPAQRARGTVPTVHDWRRTG
jgi:hypothetical protein